MQSYARQDKSRTDQKVLMPCVRSRLDPTWSTGYLWSHLAEKDKLKREAVWTEVIRCAVLWAQVAATRILPAPCMLEKYSGLTPRTSEIITSPQLGSFLEPLKMAPSLQSGESGME